MNIEQIKQLAELKEAEKQASDRYNAQVDARKKTLIESVAKEFTDYMTKHGFTVKENSEHGYAHGHNRTSIEASYCGITFTLHLPLLSEQPIGARARFGLIQSGKKPHVVVAMVQDRDSLPPPNSKDEIELAKFRVASIEHLTKQMENEKIAFFVDLEESKKPIFHSTPYPTFAEALAAYIGQQ